MREDLRESLWFAGALVFAYWMVSLTEFLWSVFCAVVKSAITNTLVP